MRALPLLLLGLSVSGHAVAKGTCNTDEKLCCDWWAADALVDGVKKGSLLEDSYQKLFERIQGEQRSDRRLCTFFEAHDDCNRTYSEARCAAPGRKTVQELVDKSEHALGGGAADEAKAAVLDKLLVRAKEELAALRRRSKLYELVEGAASATARQLDDGARNPYAGIGQNLYDYADLLAEAVQRVEALREKVRPEFAALNPYFFNLDLGGWTNGDPALKLWDNNGTFGGLRERKATQDLSAAGVHNLQAIVDGARRVPELQIAELRLAGSARVWDTNGSGRFFIGTEMLRDGASVLAGDHDVFVISSAGGSLRVIAPTIKESRAGYGRKVSISTLDTSTQLFSCPPNSNITNGECVCSSNAPHWSASAQRCVACGAAQQFDGDSCVCPQGSHKNGSACVTCAGNQVWENGSCQCPKNLAWSEEQQRCKFVPRLGATSCVDGTCTEHGSQ